MNVLDKFRYSKDDPSQLNISLKKDPYEKSNVYITQSKVTGKKCQSRTLKTFKVFVLCITFYIYLTP